MKMLDFVSGLGILCWEKILGVSFFVFVGFLLVFNRKSDVFMEFEVII